MLSMKRDFNHSVEIGEGIDKLNFGFSAEDVRQCLGTPDAPVPTLRIASDYMGRSNDMRLCGTDPCYFTNERNERTSARARHPAVAARLPADGSRAIPRQHHSRCESSGNGTAATCFNFSDSIAFRRTTSIAAWPRVS